MNDNTMTSLNPAPQRAAAMRFDMAAGFAVGTFDEVWRMAQLMASSDFVPKDYKDKPANIVVALQMAAELGLKPMQGLQNIAVVNGRPGIFGDAGWALVQQSPLVEDISESWDDVKKVYTVSIKRKGRSTASVQSYGDEDAKQAGLLGKSGPWSTNPKRMKQWRARWFAARDAVPDVLKGLPIIEATIGDEPLPSKPEASHSPTIAAINEAVAAMNDAPAPEHVGGDPTMAGNA